MFWSLVWEVQPRLNSYKVLESAATKQGDFKSYVCGRVNSNFQHQMPILPGDMVGVCFVQILQVFQVANRCTADTSLCSLLS